jgi:hypothetical protein
VVQPLFADEGLDPFGVFDIVHDAELVAEFPSTLAVENGLPVLGVGDVQLGYLLLQTLDGRQFFQDLQDQFLLVDVLHRYHFVECFSSAVAELGFEVADGNEMRVLLLGRSDDDRRLRLDFWILDNSDGKILLFFEIDLPVLLS